jgi:threonine synthase
MSESTQVCEACATSYKALDARARCACGGLLEVRNPPPKQRGDVLKALFTERHAHPRGSFGSGVWRYRELVMPDAGGAVVSHPEGNTPLLSRGSITSFAGVDSLSLKHEGHNPTGSFKDRGMTVGVTQALRLGASAVACASTGNTSASLGAYAAQAGLPSLVVVPAGKVALGKLAQSLAYGAKTLLVRGDFDDCLRLVSEANEKLGVYLVNSINPFRLEGQKTIMFEMLEQLGWDPPDWVAVPAGNLGNTSAFGKALVEAKELGLIPRMPRLAAIQAAGAAPFARSFAEGFAERYRVKAETVATAIQIGDPASFHRAVKAIRSTNGVVAAVTDAEILDAKAAIDAAGVGCEPASAASVAGVKKLVAEGVIQKGEKVVAVLTGHVLKDSGILLRYHQETDPPPRGANRPIEIEAKLSALEKVMLG